MKLFRRIFALTMVVAMVCLFSASAFGYAYDEGYPFNDTENSHVFAYADIFQYSTYGRIEIEPTALINQSIDISAQYEYTYLNGGISATLAFGNETTTNTTLTADLSLESARALHINWVEYTYDVNFTTLSNDFNEFYRGPIHIEYNHNN